MGFLDYVLRLIFPNRCIFCGNPTKLYSDNPNVCENCVDSVHEIYVDNCVKCGAELVNHSNPYCRDCQSMNYICTDGVSVFNYRDVKKTIFHFKYKGYKTDGVILGKYMADCLNRCNCKEILKSDVIVPVPISRKKEKKRGFNQTEILADELSAEIGVTCCKDMLKRVKNTVPQSKLTGMERKYNVMNVFKVNDKYSIDGKNVLLVDDIFTTGSTIEECARTLMYSGADKVYYITLSRVI